MLLAERSAAVVRAFPRVPMMSVARVVVPGLVLAAGLFASTSAEAKPDIDRQGTHSEHDDHARANDDERDAVLFAAEARTASEINRAVSLTGE